MNGPTRKKIYRELVLRDGDLCQFCARSPKEMQLVIDHIDNDNSNNDKHNLRLLCRRCNYIKNPRRPVDVCENENLSEEMSELKTSHTKKPLFRKFIWHEINELGEVPEKHLLDSSAEELDISQITAKRWLDAMCSSRGALERIKRVKTIMIRIKQTDLMI